MNSANYENTHISTPQDSLLVPLLANIASAVLDKHLHMPRKPRQPRLTSTPTPWLERTAELAPSWLRGRFCSAGQKIPKPHRNTTQRHHLGARTNGIAPIRDQDPSSDIPSPSIH